MEADVPGILVRRREVEVIESGGIGSLVPAYYRARARGGVVRLVQLPQRPLDASDRSGLDPARAESIKATSLPRSRGNRPRRGR